MTGQLGVLNVGAGEGAKISRKLALRKYRAGSRNAQSQARYYATPRGRKVRQAIDARYHAANKPKRAAKRAVAHAIRRGRLPKARFLPCFECLGDAAEYHHPSYARDDRLKVVPLCKKCHKALHYCDQTAAVEALGLIRGWLAKPVISHVRVPDRFGRAGYAGSTVLFLACGHSKSIRGSQAIPRTGRCFLCASNQEESYEITG